LPRGGGGGKKRWGTTERRGERKKRGETHLRKGGKKKRGREGAWPFCFLKKRGGQDGIFPHLRKERRSGRLGGGKRERAIYSSGDPSLLLNGKKKEQSLEVNLEKKKRKRKKEEVVSLTLPEKGKDSVGERRGKTQPSIPYCHKEAGEVRKGDSLLPLIQERYQGGRHVPPSSDELLHKGEKKRERVNWEEKGKRKGGGQFVLTTFGRGGGRDLTTRGEKERKDRFAIFVRHGNAKKEKKKEEKRREEGSLFTLPFPLKKEKEERPFC